MATAIPATSCGTEGPHFVDLDDCCMGPAVQDLWMLLSGERDERSRQLGWLLDGYFEFADFDPRELRLIEPLRTLRMIHYAGWLARRWDDPAFPAAFPWFNTQRYWQDHILALREQAAALDEPPPLALVALSGSTAASRCAGPRSARQPFSPATGH